MDSDSASGDVMDGALRTPDVARARLYEIMGKDASVATKAEQALELGERYFDVDNGHVARVDQESDYWEAIASSGGPEGDYAVGTVIDLQETFCRKTIRRDGPIALHDVPQQGWAEDPAYQSTGLGTYHGSTIVVGNRPFGTVCFVAEEPREEAFADHETMFAELVARMLEYELAGERFESELQRRSDLLDVVNRVLRHNLRTEMNIIRGKLQSVVERNDDLSAEFDSVIDSADRLLQLGEAARNLDTFVRRNFEYEATDLVSVTKNVLQTAETEYPAADVEVDGPETAMHPVKPTLRTALEELVENAVKHAPDPEVRVQIDETGDGARVEIADNGPGLPKQERSVLSEGTETPLVHGSGLGLWMVHWIVTDHDGTIEATATDEGTRITIVLPPRPVQIPIQN
jgi:signal transduction histidine kinase